MTTLTLKLKLTDADVSKAQALIKTGEIASALLEVSGVEIVDVTDDALATVAPVEVKARRTRGPNKSKPEAAKTVEETGADANQIDAHEMPGFLRREKAA